MKLAVRLIGSAIPLCVLLAALGCETGRGTGAAVGAGLGAFVGQGMGRTATSTLIGAGVGAAGGYIIGNEADQAKVRRGEKVTLADLQPLAGTSWTFSSISPESARTFASMVLDFRPDGILHSSRTEKDGTVVTDEEHYRVVNQTLIVSDTNYILNGPFIFQDRSLTIVVGDTTSRWTRVGG